MIKILKPAILVLMIMAMWLCASMALPGQMPGASESSREGLQTAQSAPGKITFTVKFDKTQVNKVGLKFDGPDRPEFITCEPGKSYVADTPKFSAATLNIQTKTGWRIKSIIVNGVDKGTFASQDFSEIGKPGKPAQYNMEIIFRKE